MLALKNTFKWMAYILVILLILMTLVVFAVTFYIFPNISHYFGMRHGEEIIENDAYFQRLLMYKGLKEAGDLINLDQQNMSDDLLNLVTQGYGVGNWFLYNGEEDRARDIFDQILATDYWSAFGYIAAEADQSR